MVKELPINVQAIINDPQAVKVLSTSSGEGMLHSVPLGSLSAPGPNVIALGKILIKETHANLEKALSNGGNVSVLAVKGGEAYQIRCKPKAFNTDGPIFQAMKEKLPNMPLTGVWLLEPFEIINQSPGPDAGKRL